MDFGEVKAHVADIMSGLDHKFLNEAEPFNDEYPPSSENIAHLVATRLQAIIEDPTVSVSRVSAWESDNACATYIAA